MNYRAHLLAAAAASLIWLPSSAQETIEPADFLTDWPSMIGERVRIHDLVVYGFAETHATAVLGDQYIFVAPPWRDREDLRYLFRHCTDILPNDRECKMTVSATIGKDATGLRLSDVDFEVR